MPTIRAWLGLMPDLVTVEPRSSVDAQGKPTFGAAVTYRARIQMRGVRLRDAQGREITGRGIVYLATTTQISRNARVTLPSGYDPQVPVILEVRPVNDDKGLHHCVLILG